MAKATAYCTCATCGKEFEVKVDGRNSGDAMSRADWASVHYDECSECYRVRVEREREAANEAAQAAADAAGLPALTGTEKQVKWATTIRQGCLDEFDRKAAKISGEKSGFKVRCIVDDVETEFDSTLAEFRRYLLSHGKASWWIDRRDVVQPGMTSSYLRYLIRELRNDFGKWMSLQRPEETPEQAAVREDAEQEMTVTPNNPSHNGVVDITVTDTMVAAKYEKNEDFRGLVKELGYSWDRDRGAWIKKIDCTTGAAKERAAELGNKLLNAGFSIRIADPETRMAAIHGQYEPQHMRWITLYGTDRFCIRLTYGDGMYEKAKAIRGAKYDKPNITVPASEYAAVEDFAGLNDYRFSPKAQELLDKKKGVTIIVAPAPTKIAVYAEHDPADILNSSSDVLDDLRD